MIEMKAARTTSNKKVNHVGIAPNQSTHSEDRRLLRDAAFDYNPEIEVTTLSKPKSPRESILGQVGQI
jgi:hypothetical protein